MLKAKINWWFNKIKKTSSWIIPELIRNCYKSKQERHERTNLNLR
jgi:hypothetical protein